MSDSVHIDGFGPLPVRRPADAGELGEIVRAARADGRAVYPVGGRTMLDVGLPPTRPGVAVSTAGLDRVIDYPARDMTVTVQAGITIAELQSVLAREGQWLPVDVPLAERATVGGAIAANASGPRRFGHGTLRDYVIGISFVDDTGAEVKGGGRVVKNVAGYDLMKLHTGALGTLGVVTQATLKVKPRPEATGSVTFGLDVSDIGPMLDLLHRSTSRPVAVELTNHVSESAPGPWMIAVGFEEKATTVDWQVSALLTELKGTPARGIAEKHGADADKLWRLLTDVQVRAESAYIWKANTLPSRVAEFVTAMAAHAPYRIHAEALNGIVWLHLDTPDPGPYSVMDQWSNRAGGTQVVRRCPSEWKSRFRVWGRPLGDQELMRHVKRTLDPDDVFNPGRLF